MASFLSLDDFINNNIDIDFTLFFKKHPNKKFIYNDLKLNLTKINKISNNKFSAFGSKSLPNNVNYLLMKSFSKNENKYKYYVYVNNNKKEIESKKINQISSKYNKFNKLLSNFQILKDNFENKKIICFDIEAYEYNQNKLIELGFAILENNKVKSKHYIIEEYYNIRNGLEIEDNKDNFLFGKSEFKSLNDSLIELEAYINDCDIIIGSGISNDLLYLKKKNIIIEKEFIFDSFDFTFLLHENGLGLKNSLHYLKIPYKFLHNAGNDAFFNILQIKKMVKLIDLEKQINKLNLLKSKVELAKIEFDKKWLV